MISMFTRLLSICFVCCIATTVPADKTVSSSLFYPSIKQHSRVALRHIDGGGIGYNKGYTTLEGFFAPRPRPSTLMPFLDIRGHVFNDGKLATNLGVGVRREIGSCRVLGLNAYYDYRHAQKINYNQIGCGVELLGKICDLRANGYIPFDRTMTCPLSTIFSGFSGNQMILKQKYRFAMRGANAELGCHIGTYGRFDFYGAVGPYYFTGKKGPHIWGGKARLMGRYKDYITLELLNSYDKMFRNRFQCELTFTLPLGRTAEQEPTERNSCYESNLLYSRMVQPVVRQEIIVEGCGTRCSTAINPETMRPFTIVFVDNTSHSRGTFESPYPTLAQAEANSSPNDIIYVLPGDGTTKGMDQGITLQLNQKFWGSGTSHSVTTAQGNIIIPALSSTAPTITNIAGNGITLASANEVSGFSLINSMDNGIFGTRARDIAISDCMIDHSQSDQIHLEYNGLAGAAAFTNLTITNGASKGIVINATSPALACSVSNCNIQDNADSSINATFDNKATVTITNNIIERNGNNTLINFEGPGSLLASNNTFSNNSSVNLSPLLMTAQASPVSATISNNTIRENVCGAIHVVLNDTQLAELTITKNMISNNGIGAIGAFGSAIFTDLNGTSSSNCMLDITHNTFLGNTGSSCYCANGTFNRFQVNASGNTSTNSGGGGFVFATGCNTFSLTANDNTISNGSDHGITTTGGITIADATISVDNNRITNNRNFASGIALSHDGTTLDLAVTRNTISNNDTSALIMYSSTAIDQVAITIENNTITGNQNLGSNLSGGIDLEQYNNLSGTLTNNIFSNNSSSGLYVGSTTLHPYTCITMTGNQNDTDYVLSSGAGIFNLAPCTVDTVNSGAITTIGAITTVQSCPGAVACMP